jgi:hypothetical protein
MNLIEILCRIMGGFELLLAPSEEGVHALARKEKPRSSFGIGGFSHEVR